MAGTVGMCDILLKRSLNKEYFDAYNIKNPLKKVYEKNKKLIFP